MKLKSLCLAFGAACLLVVGQTYGHAMLEKSSPANNSVLTTAPKSIDLTFGHPAKLVALKLQKDAEVIPLTIDATAPSSTSFSIALPVLAAGTYVATWSTMADDGHAMKGKITFTISGK